MRPNTRAVLTESPGSLTLEVQDIPAIADVAHARGACVIMDNTWATPLFFSPHARGVDLAVEAGTKYLSGHSDLLIGLVSANAAWAVRLREAERQALALAHWLEARPEVLRVIHPALPGYAGHELWMRDFTGSSGL